MLSGNTEVPARNLHQHIQNLMQTDPGDNVTPMELEFKNLANVKAEPARSVKRVKNYFNPTRLVWSRLIVGLIS